MSDRYPECDVLLAEAVERTGLADFGPGDFREGLEALLESLRRDAGLAASTDTQVLGDIRRRLDNRLEVEEWLRRHPSVASVPVEGPVDVIGLPRTGTTAVGNMLSLDPQFRCLREWEQLQPVPPPTTEGEASDPRYLGARQRQQSLPAHLRAMHLYDVDATVEDSHLLGMAFHGQQYTLPVYGYHAWWRTSDCRDTFAYHRRVLALLGSQRPPLRWLLKAPHHKFHLEALVAAYPDTRFVMMHRDPAAVVPSYASLVSALFPAAANHHDLRRLGRELTAHLRQGMERALQARARLGEHRFIDVHHRELLADPLGAVRRVYDFAGLQLRSEVEQRMAVWCEANRKGAHGLHRYGPEQFGLRADQLRDEFGFYIRRFDIEVEG